MEDDGNAEGAASGGLGGGLGFGQKTIVALLLFGVVAVLAWQTMEPGKFRTLVFVILGGLALRVLLGWRRSSDGPRSGVNR
jgi:hypothetical protein